MRGKRSTLIVCVAAAALAAITLTASPASAAYVTVHGGPTYTPGVDELKVGGLFFVSDTPTAVGMAQKYDALGTDQGIRAIRWNGPGTTVIELGNLGTNTSGFAYNFVFVVDSAGTAFGEAQKYPDNSEIMSSGSRPVRWNSSSTAATEMAHLGTGNYLGVTNYTESGVYAINTAGTPVGYAFKFDSAGEYHGIRAVRWNNMGTLATELENLGSGTGVVGDVFTSARAINDAGTAVGDASKFDSTGAYLGTRPVRWDASGATATELGILGTNTAGRTQGYASAINGAGTAIGVAHKFDASGIGMGDRAVRWDASGTAATELGNLGTNTGGHTESMPIDVNDAGTVVGSAQKYDSSGVNLLGNRAVRWDASGTTATELGNLGTTNSGYTQTFASAINNAGIAVGGAEAHNGSGMSLGYKAVYWGLDPVAVDLNTLIDPASGWILNHAVTLSDTGWISGSGTFDPDGAGGQPAYERAFLIQVPEPSGLTLLTLALLGFGVAALRVRRRRPSR